MGYLFLTKHVQYIGVIIIPLINITCTDKCYSWANEKCRTGDDCYYISYRCDGKNNCLDGSDEDSCILEECPWFGRSSARVFCHSTQTCFNKRSEICDCVPSCRSGETCCTDGSGCYAESQKCDKVNNCKNGADEEYCSHVDAGGFPWMALITPLLIFVVVGILVVVCVLQKRKQRQMFRNAQGSQPVIVGGSIPMCTQPVQSNRPISGLYAGGLSQAPTVNTYNEYQPQPMTNNQPAITNINQPQPVTTNQPAIQFEYSAPPPSYSSVV